MTLIWLIDADKKPCYQRHQLNLRHQRAILLYEVAQSAVGGLRSAVRRRPSLADAHPAAYTL